jgi:hypothetical protein
MTDTTQTIINQRPAYIQNYDEALLQRIMGKDDGSGNFTGGLIDQDAYPDLFNTLNYTQADNTLQDAIGGSFDTAEQRQAFMDRYQPYFMDEDGTPKYLPQAGTAVDTGSTTIADALTDYFPDAQGYLDKGVGSVDAESIYDIENFAAKTRADQGTQGFDAKTRADSLFTDAKAAVKGGIGKFDPTAVDSFMNPYQEKVMDAALAKIDREAAKTRQAGAAQAIGRGAFGGSRAGVQAAETERAIAEQKQNTIAGLMSQGYDKAMTGAQSAFENAQKRGIAGGQQLGSIGSTQLGAEEKSFEGAEGRMLKAADMYRTMGLSSAEAQARAGEDEKKRYLETGRLTGGLGSAVGQLGGAQVDTGKTYAGLANTAANIGTTYAGMQPSDMGFMYELGGKERQYDQQYNDFQRANEALKTTDALAPYSYAQNFLTGSPSASMYGQFTQAPSTNPDPFIQGIGAYATYQGMQ